MYEALTLQNFRLKFFVELMENSDPYLNVLVVLSFTAQQRWRWELSTVL